MSTSKKRPLREIYAELEALEAAGALTHAEWMRHFEEAQQAVPADEHVVLAGFAEHKSTG